MDLGEWVFVPDVEFLEIYYDKGEKKEEDCWRSFFGDPAETGCAINKDYFICSSPDSPKPMNCTENVSFQNQLEHSDDDDDDDDLVVTILPPSIEPNFLPSVIAEKVVFPTSTYDQDDDLFKKFLEYELVHDDDDVKLPMNTCSKDSGRRVQIWRWSFKGFGAAICSFGVAAATICFITFFNHHHHLQKKLNNSTTMKMQDQGNHQIKKIRFPINDNNKRIKQVFEEATKLSEVISGVRVVPRRAQFSFGGNQHQES